MGFLSSFGYYVLKDQYYMPRSLGGSGDYALVFSKHPYPEHCSGLQDYYMLVITYHLGSLINHVIGKRNSDFVEMTLHHFVTMGLLLYSYMFNVWECGAVISFIHDFTDCIGHSVKVSCQLENYDNTTFYIFATVMVTWGWARNLVFPYCVYQIYNTFFYYKNASFEQGNVTVTIYIYFLSCLVVLHYYWYDLFIKVITKAKYEGKYVDM